MYKSSINSKVNFRAQIQKFASESIINNIIQKQLIYVKIKNKKIPQHVKDLPKNHFLLQILQKQNIVNNFSNLQPFVSPNAISKAYNKIYSKNKFYIMQIYYYYEPTLNNQKLFNIVDPMDFFFNAKNQSKQKNLDLSNKIQNLKENYLSKNKSQVSQSYQYQNTYVIPLNYFPLIAIKIKYQFMNPIYKKGFEYLIIRYDEYLKSKLDSISVKNIQNQRKMILKKLIQLKKLKNSSKIKPQEIQKKQQLKKVYSINNFFIGWIDKQINQHRKDQEYILAYFDIQALQNNICQNKNKKQIKFRTKKYLFFKKGQFQIPRIQIISFLYDDIVIKCAIKLSDITQIDFYSSGKHRQIYLHLNNYPQYYFHALNSNNSSTLFNLGPWQRIQNFSIQNQTILAQSSFMRNYLANNSVIGIDFRTGKKQINKVLKYFQAQQIIHINNMRSRPFNKTINVQKNNILYLQNLFNSALQCKENQRKIIVHQIKFSLLSLKSIRNAKINFNDMINYLEEIKQQGLQSLQKHNDALKMLCLLPHELLSKSFKQVYQKFYKKLQLLDKLGSYFPQLQKFQLMKLQKKIQDQILSQVSQISLLSDIDTLSQISDIYQNSQISDVDLQIFDQIKFMVKQIENTRYILLPRVKLTPNGIVYSGWTLQVASKVLKHYKDFQYQFLKCEIKNDQNKKIVSSPHLLQNYLRKQMDKIQIINQTYVPLGWSQSQLRQGILWYTLQSKHIKTIKRQQILQFLGDFNEKKNPKLFNPALKAARIGQNFGSSWSFDASQINFIYQDDKYADKFKNKIYTDGIGCISQINMNKFRVKLGLDSLAAIQIRYKGIKGILSLNKKLQPNTAIIRKSMVKYQCLHPQSVKYFDIIDYSKYKVGYLNRQIIILLISNHISVKSILDLQTQYIKSLQKNVFQILLENISFEDEQQHIFEIQNNKKFQSLSQVFKMILNNTWQDKNAQINNIIFDLPFFNCLKIQAKRRLLSKLRQKCRIRVQKSTRLFGILDQFNILKQYEVYCSILPNLKKNIKIKNDKRNIAGKCILTKNPCLHPADIRVVTCVSDEQIKNRLIKNELDPNLFQDLVNVIIFPQQGKNPLTMEISQSDLDGDQFFLSWDQRIVPYKNFDPFIIAQQVPFIQRKWTGAGYKQMLDFFMQYQNFNKLGRLANNHLIHADLKGAFSHQCIQMCKTHSVAVQYPKRGYDFNLQGDLLFHMYPHFMQKQYPLKSYKSLSILGQLYNQIMEVSNIKFPVNQQLIFKNQIKVFDNLNYRYMNAEIIGKFKDILAINYSNMLSQNSVYQKFNNIFQQQAIQLKYQNDQLQNQQGQQPISFSEVQKEQQIQYDQIQKNKQIRFTKKMLTQISQILNKHQNLRQIDSNQVFSIVQILSAFNYLHIYSEQLKYLSQFLQNQYQSIYTIYFQLHSSCKNKNNQFILQRINNFRQRWLYFFGQQLINDKVFQNTNQFQNFYFNKLIYKKQLQKQKKSLNSRERLLKLFKRKLPNKKVFNFNQNFSYDYQFIDDEIHNLNIKTQQINYDNYNFISIQQINIKIFRKLYLYYMVSNHFDQLIQSYTMKKLIQLIQQKNRKLFLKMKITIAKIFYGQNKLSLLGFCWFSLPKLMVVWWKNTVQKESFKIKEKIIQKMQKQDKKELKKDFKIEQNISSFKKIIYTKQQIKSINNNKCQIY